MPDPPPNQPPYFADPLDPCNLPIRRCPTDRDRAEKRILIVRLGAFGDILMATVLLPGLRAAYPNAHITWMVERSERQAIEANPYIDEIIVWDSMFWKRKKRRLNYPSLLYQMFRVGKLLRERRYDLFISFQPEEWAWLLRGVNARTTVGIFDTFRRYYRAAKTSKNVRLYDHAYVHPNLPDHRIDQYLLAFDALKIDKPTDKTMSLGYTEDDRRFAESFLQANNLSDFVVLVPKTTWSTKCWQSENYVELANRLHARGLQIVLTGSAKEREAIEQIAADIANPPIVAAGTMTFLQMAAVLHCASLVISGDTGPMHAASALDVPYVALFGPTSPQWYAPLAGHGIALIHPVPCGPCDQKNCPNPPETHEICMRLLTVDTVFAAALDRLAMVAPIAGKVGL